MKTICWSCHGSGVLVDRCDICEGTGTLDESRLHVMSRRKRYFGRNQPGADKNGHEKWLRLVAELPPEFGPEIDRLARKVWSGHTVKPPSRAAIVRAALIEWMDRHDPEPESVDVTGEEVIERLEIAEASVVDEADNPEDERRS